jgi:hypothetical protein
LSNVFIDDLVFYTGSNYFVDFISCGNSSSKNISLSIGMQLIRPQAFGSTDTSSQYPNTFTYGDIATITLNSNTTANNLHFNLRPFIEGVYITPGGAYLTGHIIYTLTDNTNKRMYLFLNFYQYAVNITRIV